MNHMYLTRRNVTLLLKAKMLDWNLKSDILCQLPKKILFCSSLSSMKKYLIGQNIQKRQFKNWIYWRINKYENLGNFPNVRFWSCLIILFDFLNAFRKSFENGIESLAVTKVGVLRISLSSVSIGSFFYDWNFSIYKCSYSNFPSLFPDWSKSGISP